MLGHRAGDDTPIVPLELVQECCEPPENIIRNIKSTLQTDYKPFNSLLCSPHGRELSICGFGPSFKHTYKGIRGDVWACNGAHNWLIDKGIIPKYGMFWDAGDMIHKFIKPHKDVTYLVASRCHRSVFEALEGHDVVVWHAMGDSCLERLLIESNRMEPMLHGGSAAVTRSMVVAEPMGYRKVHLFGGDSSYTTTTHVNESIVAEKPMRVWFKGKWFDTTPWLAGQVEDFRVLAPVMKEMGVELVLHGDGLLQSFAKELGFTVVPDSEYFEPEFSQ